MTEAESSFVGDRAFRSRQARNRAVLSTVGTIAVVLGATWALHASAPFLFSPTWAREAVAAQGAWAPAAYVALQAVQVVLAPVPGQTLGFVGGYLFGALAGTVYSMVGVVLGSLFVFGLARRWGRSVVESWVAPDALERFDGFVEDRGAVALFVVFLLPTFPDDAICFLAGLSEIRWRTFLALLVVGRLPSFLAVAVAGDQVAAANPFAFAAVAVAAGGATVLVYLRRDRVESALAHLGRGT